MFKCTKKLNYFAKINKIFFIQNTFKIQIALKCYTKLKLLL